MRVLLVQNLTEEFSEQRLLECFETYGPITLVKKIETRDCTFIYFKERDHAVRAMEILNGCSLHGATLLVSLAKPNYKSKF